MVKDLTKDVDARSRRGDSGRGSISDVGAAVRAVVCSRQTSYGERRLYFILSTEIPVRSTAEPSLPQEVKLSYWTGRRGERE